MENLENHYSLLYSTIISNIAQGTMIVQESTFSHENVRIFLFFAHNLIHVGEKVLHCEMLTKISARASRMLTCVEYFFSRAHAKEMKKLTKVINIGSICKHGMSKGSRLCSSGLMGRVEDVIQVWVPAKHALVEVRGDCDTMLLKRMMSKKKG